MTTKRGYKTLFIEGGFSFANFTLLNGVFLIGFALALGANEFEIGLLTAIPLLANLIQLVSPYILEATGSKKWTSVISLFIGRFLWIIIIFMAFGVFIFTKPILMFMTILAVSSIFIAVGYLSTLSWMKNIVPLKDLASFWGKRNIYASVAGIIAYLVGSYFIDQFSGIRIYGYIFLAAFILGLFAVVLTSSVPERIKTIKAVNPIEFFKRQFIPFKDKNFKPLLYFSILWGFSINLAAPYILVFMLDDLKLSFLLVSSFLVAETIARVYGLNLFSGIVEKYGAKPVLLFSATITTLTPLVFIFINSSNYLIGLVMIMVVGAVYAGFDISIGQIMFKSAPRRYDAYYLSSFNSLTNFFSALGPILGGAIAVFIRSRPDLGALNILEPLKYIFLVSFILRVMSIPLIYKIKDKKAGDVNDIINKMKTLRFASFFVNFYSIAHYTSKIVLVPQKQFFILQRKAANRMGKDISNTIGLMIKMINSLNNVSKKNIYYTKKRIHDLNTELSKQVKGLHYFAGSLFEKVPKNISGKVKDLERKIQKHDAGAIKEVKEIVKEIEKASSKLEKVSGKEIGKIEKK